MDHSLLTQLETIRQIQQHRFDSRTPAEQRNRRGQFATPPLLAREIAQYLRIAAGDHLPNLSFADPAFGSGSLYAAALAEFGAERIVSAIGIEIDEDLCSIARTVWAETGLQVVCGDCVSFLTNNNYLPTPNLIIANPPYVRHHHLDLATKRRLQALTMQRTGIHVSGLAGLYVYVVLLSMAWLARGGYAAWLLPAEWMDVGYGAALRRFFCEQVTLIRIHRFHPADTQFADALVSSTVVVLRNEPPPPDHCVVISTGGTLLQPQMLRTVPLTRLSAMSPWSAIDAALTPTSETSPARPPLLLGDVFDIRRGIVTGGNDFFILKRATARQLGLPDACLRPMLPPPRFLTTTVIEADDDGYPCLQPQLCLIDCDLAEEQVRAQYPALWAYLQTAPAELRQRYLVRRRKPWYRQERRDPAPFLCTYMGRRTDSKSPFRLIWNRSQAIPPNVYLMLYPKGELARLLHQEPDRTAELFAILQDINVAEFAVTSRVYGGGLHKLEPSELARVPATKLVERWPEVAGEAAVQVSLW